MAWSADARQHSSLSSASPAACFSAAGRWNRVPYYHEISKPRRGAVGNNRRSRLFGVDENVDELKGRSMGRSGLGKPGPASKSYCHGLGQITAQMDNLKSQDQEYQKKKKLRACKTAMSLLHVMETGKQHSVPICIYPKRPF